MAVCKVRACIGSNWSISVENFGAERTWDRSSDPCGQGSLHDFFLCTRCSEVRCHDLLWCPGFFQVLWHVFFLSPEFSEASWSRKILGPNPGIFVPKVLCMICSCVRGSPRFSGMISFCAPSYLRLSSIMISCAQVSLRFSGVSCSFALLWAFGFWLLVCCFWTFAFGFLLFIPKSFQHRTRIVPGTWRE